MKPNQSANTRRAFSLIELLVVIAIVAILVGLLMYAIQRVRASAMKAACSNNLRQISLAVLNYEAARKRFPRGNEPGVPTATNCFQSSTPTGVNANTCGASWLFSVLPFAEEVNFYESVRDSGSIGQANTAGLLARKIPFVRCPSDPWVPGNFLFCNYIGSSGPQCNNPSAGCAGGGGAGAPFQMYCNGTVVTSNSIPPLLMTYAGYAPSFSKGTTALPDELRGMFGRGPITTSTSPGAPTILRAMVTDGSSSTILLGETLIEHAEYQRFNTTAFGWLGYGTVSCGQTIQPINYRIDRTLDTVSSVGNCNATTCPNGPATCVWNSSVTWGFRSNHSGGANFAFVDGSTRFLKENIDHQTYQYLGCRNDGQSVNESNY